MYHSKLSFDENPGAMQTDSMQNLDSSFWTEYDKIAHSFRERLGLVGDDRQYQNEFDPDLTSCQYSNFNSFTRTGTWSGSVGGCKVIL
jgi:hypothetical protein